MPSIPMRVVIISGRLVGATVPLDRPLLLGRDPRSRLVLDDPQISRLHALIEVAEGNEVTVRDLGSRNGLWHNGERVEGQRMLRPGDQLRIGDTVLAIEEGGGEVGLRRADSSGSGFGNLSDTASRQRSLGSVTPTSFGAPSSEDSSVRVTPKLLRTAFEFATLCATLREPRQLDAWFLPRCAQLFRSDGAVMLLGPGFGFPQWNRVHSCGGTFVAEVLASSQWDPDHIRMLSVSLDILGKPAVIDVMSTPLLVEERFMGLLLAWRGSGVIFEAKDEVLARAVFEALLGGPLGRVLERIASRKAVQDVTDDLGFIGESQTMTLVREALQRVGVTGATVLLTGESGTGKEVSARAIVAVSPRREEPFVAINAAAIPRDLLEAELFGYEKGAFTGAAQAKPGKLELADGGTVFLDEIGELPLELQAKLLRVLEGQTFYRVGGQKEVQVDIRFICATNRPLERMVEERTFRADLFHRINILRVHLPSLRDHIEDLPDLIAFLLEELRQSHNLTAPYTMKQSVLAHLMRYDWPGNVRELRNVLERMILLSDSTELHDGLIPKSLAPRDPTSTEAVLRLSDRTQELERAEIMRALIGAEGMKSQASRTLGISRPTLDRKIKQHNLEHLCRGHGDGQAD